MQVKENPYDQWKRFKLPLLYKAFLIFLSKADREEMLNKVQSINKIRMTERKKELDDIREKCRPHALYKRPSSSRG